MKFVNPSLSTYLRNSIHRGVRLLPRRLREEVYDESAARWNIGMSGPGPSMSLIVRYCGTEDRLNRSLTHNGRACVFASPETLSSVRVVSSSVCLPSTYSLQVGHLDPPWAIICDSGQSNFSGSTPGRRNRRAKAPYPDDRPDLG